MNDEKWKMLETYIRSGILPLLVPNVSSNLFKNPVILKAKIDQSELNGHYEEKEFCPPTWYRELLEKSKIAPVVLIIENLDELELKEQSKFIEILKYKKVSTFDLPKNCLVIVTYNDLSQNKLNEEVYSLLAQI